MQGYYCSNIICKSTYVCVHIYISKCSVLTGGVKAGCEYQKTPYSTHHSIDLYFFYTFADQHWYNSGKSHVCKDSESRAPVGWQTFTLVFYTYGCEYAHTDRSYTHTNVNIYTHSWIWDMLLQIILLNWYPQSCPFRPQHGLVSLWFRIILQSGSHCFKPKMLQRRLLGIDFHPILAKLGRYGSHLVGRFTYILHQIKNWRVWDRFGTLHSFLSVFFSV